MTRIDDKTSIPLKWVVLSAWFGGAAILAGVVVACTWVFTVNARLARIEDKLGITQPVAQGGFIPNAEGALGTSGKKK